jgi:heme oxygenase
MTGSDRVADDAGTGDVLLRMRTATAADHGRVEAVLDLLDPALDQDRLVRAMCALHGFWSAAEDGLARWADRCPDDAARVDWPQRRRASLFEADLRALGATPGQERPALPEVRNTDEALGRMYVLEGATLGGSLIDRHLRRLPALAGVRLTAFSPYGARTGAMWHAYRRATRAQAAGAGDADRVVRAASETFDALAHWIDARQRVPV